MVQYTHCYVKKSKVVLIYYDSGCLNDLPCKFLWFTWGPHWCAMEQCMKTIAVGMSTGIAAVTTHSFAGMNQSNPHLLQKINSCFKLQCQRDEGSTQVSLAMTTTRVVALLTWPMKRYCKLE